MNKKLFWKIPVCAASILISCRYLETRWVVGPVFAVAYLVANADKLKKHLWLKYLLFLTASTLTYAAVHLIVDKGGPYFKGLLIDEISGGVLFGSLTLPFLHGKLFSIPFKTVLKTLLCLSGSWYVIIVFSGEDTGDIRLPVGITINSLHMAVAFWQGLYFYLLRGRVDTNPAPAVPT